MKNIKKAVLLLFFAVFAVQAQQIKAQVEFTDTVDNFQLWLDTVVPVLREVSTVTDSPVIHIKLNDGKACWIYTACANPPDKIWVPPMNVGNLKEDINKYNGFTHELRHLKPGVVDKGFFTEGLAVSGANTVHWLLSQRKPGILGFSDVFVTDILRSNNPYAVGVGVGDDQYNVWTLYPDVGGMLELLSGGDFRKFDQEILATPVQLHTYDLNMKAADKAFPLFDGWKPSDYLKSSPDTLKSAPDGKYLAVAVILNSPINDSKGNQVRGDTPIINFIDVDPDSYSSPPFQFIVHDWKDEHVTWRKDGTLNWEIRDATNKVVSSGTKTAAGELMRMSMKGLFGALQLNACWNDPADPNADCVVGDPAAINATTYFIAVNLPQLVLLGDQFWKDRIYVIKNSYDFQGFSDKQFELVSQPGDLPEMENIPGFEGVLAIRLHGSKKPVVVTDGVRSKTYTPSYWALPDVESATRIPLWTEFGDKLQAVANNGDWANNYLVKGSIFALFGKGFTPHGPTRTTAIPLPTTLDDIQVVVRVEGTDYPAPLYYTSATQINFQVPNEIPASATDAYIVVLMNGVPSNPIYAQIRRNAPALFYGDWNSKQAATVFAAGFKVGQSVTTGNPVRAGEYVSLYGTGLGPVNPPAKSGDKTGARLSVVTDTVAVTIGGKPVPYVWAGLAPEFVGLYQLNVQIPAGLPAGLADVTVTVNGVPNAVPAKLAVAP